MRRTRVANGYDRLEADIEGEMRQLRDWLIMTTSTVTYDQAIAHLRTRLDDPAFLSELLDIALEGEDAGDAPWAAVNVIEEFSPSLLRRHLPQLTALAGESWTYLSDPAKRALAKLA